MVKKICILLIICLMTTSFANAQSIKNQAELNKQQQQYKQEEKKRQQEYERVQKSNELKEQNRQKKAQLDVSNLLELVKSNDFGYIDKFITNRGWVFESTSNTEVEESIWSFDKSEYYSDRAKAWLHFENYNELGGMITYIVANDEAIDKMEKSITANGFIKVENTKTVERGLQTRYQTSQYELIMTKLKKSSSDEGADIRYMFELFDYKKVEKALQEKAEAEQRAKEEEERLAKEKRIKEEKYSTAVKNAENALSEKNYLQSEKYYNEALSIYPEKVDFITTQIKEVKQAEIDEKYDNAVSQGDEYFTEKKYDLAKEYYQKALQINPEKASAVNTKIKKVENISVFLIERKTKIYNYSETNNPEYKRIDNQIFEKIKATLEEEKNIESQTITITFDIDTLGKTTCNIQPSINNKPLKKLINDIALSQATLNGWNVMAKAIYSYTFSAETSVDAYKKNVKGTSPYNYTVNSLINYNDPYGKYIIHLQKIQINNKTFTDNKVLKYIETGGAGNVFLSILMPGLGDHKVTYGKKTGVGTTLFTYALIGGGIGLKFYSINEYKKYHIATEQTAMDLHYSRANYANQAFYTGVIVGGAIWLYDIIWVLNKGAKNQSEHKTFRQSHFGLYYNPDVNATGLTYTLKF